MKFRVGLGQDSHKFVKEGEEKPLILGGIEIKGERGFEANSDGDVIFHALFNALASAIGERSIGVYADPLLKKGITDSGVYLGKAFQMILAEDFKVNNIAISVEAAKPRLEKHEEKIKRNIARILQVDVGRVGLTFTSGEGLSAFGRGEGVQAMAVVSLV